MGIMLTPEWIGVNFILKIAILPVTGNSHQLMVRSSHHISNSDGGGCRTMDVDREI